MNNLNKYREYRLRAGLTQAELAEKLDVTQCVVSMWETGRHEPSMKSLKKMSKLYGVGLFDLLFEGAEAHENTRGAAEGAARA